MLADLDDDRAFAILDAKDLAAAHELLGARAEKLGVHALDEWFASDCLEILAGG
jgi:diadenosine tetraphosphate (Ap4A) HIT family hydrolase